MLFEELFHSFIARSHSMESERSREGELILQRLKELGAPTQSGKDHTAASIENIEITTTSLELK